MDWRVRSVTELLFLGFLLALIECGTAEQRVVCYYTNWSVYRPGTAKFSPQNINPYLCTHLIYAFGGFTKENTLKPFDKYQDIEKGGYAKFTGLKTYNKNLKTMLAVGGWNEGSSRFSPMVADPERRKQFVRNTVKFLRQNHFDGLDLDWEYPAFRDGGKPRDKDNYASLVQELREAYDREASKTGRPRLLLTMAVPAGIEYINKGYDIPKLNKYLDFINLLSYDYHSSYEPAVNHHSPLYPLEEDNEYNFDTELTVDYTIKHLLENGASADKIVLGIPTYGRSYTLFNEEATDIGSPADGPGEEGDATREKGYLAYYEICEALANSDEWEVVSPNPNAMGPYAYSGNQWVGYDDEAIVRLKAEYVTENGLGGIMFWSIDNDDFRGKCHSRPYPLIEAAKEAMLAGNDRTSVKEKPARPSRTRTENNFISRKLGAGRRTRTTETPVVIRQGNSRKQINALRSKNRSNTRDNSEEEETQVQVHNGRNRGQFYGEDEEDEDQTSNNSGIGSNVVRSVDDSEDQDQDKESPRPQSTNRAKTTQGRRKRPENSRRRSTTAPSISEPSAARGGSNRITTPAPPTTPDPGTDFKCEDEGFFSHPRDCKKYFWCLDAGPGGLGIVAHHFTCPSGLVFNKAADSCDYPRNVVCPKVKAAEAPTTRAPIIAATSRATRISSTTRRSASSTTPESNEYSEEYEYYDEDDEDEQVPVTTTTARNLQYKTLNRNRPTTSTTSAPTTTTQISRTTTSRSYQTIPSRSSTIDAITSLEESEEDPRVIKELIELIRKAGGIEELEKQLHLQGKGSDPSSEQSGSVTDKADVTPATISRSLYDRVLNRQAGNSGNTLFRRTTVAPTTTSTEVPEKLDEQASAPQRSRPSFKNGPGQAQFEGLDDIPEVKSLRRERPQYVTINRQRPSTPLPDETSEEIVKDNTDGASSDETLAIDPPEPAQSTQSPRRETHGYVEIRRSRTTTTRSNILDDEDEDETDLHNQRRRPATPETETAEANDEDESKDSQSVSEPVVTRRRNQFAAQEKASGTTSRYATIQRVRSTTQAPEEASSEDGDEVAEESRSDSPADIVTTTTPGYKIEDIATPTETPVAVITPEVVDQISSTSQTPELVSQTDLPQIVENVDLSTTSLPITEKVTEESSTAATSTIVTSSSTEESYPEELVTKSSPATVAQPRPFGFNRRTRPTTTTTTTLTPSLETTTTSSSVSSDSGRVKVPSETVRLPTLKELIGLSTIVAHDYTTTTSPITLSIKNLLNDEVINREYIGERVAPTSDKEPILPAGEAEKKQVDIVEENQFNELEAPKNNDYRNGRGENGFSNFDKSSLPTTESSPATLPIRVLKQDRNRSRRRRIKFVNVPVRILEADRPLTDVILEVPEHKLNSILKSLLRVEILSQDSVPNIDSKKSKTSNNYGQRVRYNSRRYESDELLSKSASTNSIRAKNQFTTTAPSISTVRGSRVLFTTKSDENRGFYVTKSIESTTPYENITPTTLPKVTELDNELIQSFSTTTDQLSTSKDDESDVVASTTESYYTEQQESTSEQFSTTTEQLTNINENPSTNTEDTVTTTSGNHYTENSELESGNTWPSIISTSLENLNNILADNDDIDSSEMVTAADYGTSTEYWLSTAEDVDDVKSTTTEPNFTESSDSEKTIGSYSAEKFSNRISDEIFEPYLNMNDRTTTSESEVDTTTEDVDYNAGTNTVATDVLQPSTADQSGVESPTEISTVSDFEITSTSTVAPDDNSQTTTNQNGDYTTESSTALGPETTTPISDSEGTSDSTTQFLSTEASTTEFQSTEATTPISDEHLDHDSISESTTTESPDMSTSFISILDQETTTFSSMDQETTSAVEFTTVESHSTIIVDETLSDSTVTDAEAKTTTVIYGGEESTSTESASTAIIPTSVDHEPEVLTTDSKDLSIDSRNVNEIANDSITQNEDKPKSVIEHEEILTQAPKIFVPLDSTDSGLPSREFYRSPSAIPGKKNLRRRVIKKRIYGVRRPHIERISDDHTIRNFTKFGTDNKDKQRFIRRRIINHTTGKVVDQILTKDSSGVLQNRTIIKTNDNSSSNPEFVGKIANDRPSEFKDTVANRLLRLRASYRGGPGNNQKTNSSIKANIISSQNNSSASNDVQSSSVSSTNPNQRRRIVIKKFRYRSSGQVNSSTLSPSPSPSSNSESPLKTEALTKQNNNSTESTVEDKRKTISGQDYTDDTIDNLSISGSETIRRISIYGSGIQELLEADADESNSEALENSEEENSNGEINLFKNRANSQRKPGTLLRPSRPAIATTPVPENEITTTISPTTKLPNNIAIRRRFRLGQRPSTSSPNAEAQSQGVHQASGVGETSKSGTGDNISESLDQIGHAQEVEVTVATGNPSSPIPPVSPGRPRFRTSIRRRIITTTEVPQRTVSPTPNPKIIRQFRQRSKPFEKISETENQPTATAEPRKRHPAITDYDYYGDTEEGIVGTTKLYGKISFSNNGTIRCLDQGNFSHPISCKKFITCSRTVNGQFIATEYTCPKKLSFDPIGGICNWSAGLGCKE